MCLAKREGVKKKGFPRQVPCDGRPAAGVVQGEVGVCVCELCVLRGGEENPALPEGDEAFFLGKQKTLQFAPAKRGFIPLPTPPSFSCRSGFPSQVLFSIIVEDTWPHTSGHDPTNSGSRE